jgi:hypothetical protein
MDCQVLTFRCDKRSRYYFNQYKRLQQTHVPRFVSCPGTVDVVNYIIPFVLEVGLVWLIFQGLISYPSHIRGTKPLLRLKSFCEKPHLVITKQFISLRVCCCQTECRHLVWRWGRPMEVSNGLIKRLGLDYSRDLKILADFSHILLLPADVSNLINVCSRMLLNFRYWGLYIGINRATANTAAAWKA